MKRLFMISFMLFGFFIWAQQTENFSGKDVAQMAVFPGCEKISQSNMAAVQGCMSNKINKN